MSEWFSGIKAKFILDFIAKQRWKYITDGLKVTLEVTFLALILGLVLGAVIAVIRTTHDQLKEDQSKGVVIFLIRPDLSSVSDSYSWYANDGTVIDHVLYCFSIF